MYIAVVWVQAQAHMEYLQAAIAQSLHDLYIVICSSCLRVLAMIKLYQMLGFHPQKYAGQRLCL